MSKRRANGEGSIRKKPSGSWEGRYTVGIDPATGELAGETAGEQAAQALKNIKHILDTAGTGIEHVCRATIYMKNVEDFHEVDDVYAQTFIGSVKPARVAFGGNDIPKGALVEIDAIAAL